jgi:hypothetical protein
LAYNGLKSKNFLALFIKFEEILLLWLESWSDKKGTLKQFMLCFGLEKTLESLEQIYAFMTVIGLNYFFGHFMVVF